MSATVSIVLIFFSFLVGAVVASFGWWQLTLRMREYHFLQSQQWRATITDLLSNRGANIEGLVMREDGLLSGDPSQPIDSSGKKKDLQSETKSWEEGLELVEVDHFGEKIGETRLKPKKG